MYLKYLKMQKIQPLHVSVSYLILDLPQPCCISTKKPTRCWIHLNFTVHKLPLEIVGAGISKYKLSFKTSHSLPVPRGVNCGLIVVLQILQKIKYAPASVFHGFLLTASIHDPPPLPNAGPEPILQRRDGLLRLHLLLLRGHPANGGQRRHRHHQQQLLLGRVSLS